MFSFMNLLRKVVDKLIPKNTIAKAMKVEIAESNVMDNEIRLWSDLYENKPPWGGEKGVCLSNLPATLSEEMARLILTEFELKVEGSPMADFINEQFERELEDIDVFVEKYCAKGGIVLKPYVSADENGVPNKVEIDVIEADKFYPTEFNSKGEIESAVFVQYKRIGDFLYTRLEYHEFKNGTITITNKAYKSEKIVSQNDGTDIAVDAPLHEEVPLTEVAEWAALSAEPVTIQNATQPLFVYIKVPKANTVDTGSPLGVSVYSRAIDLIHEADRLLGEIVWEYEAKEAAIHVTADMLDTDKEGKPVIPEGHERLYRALTGDGEKPLFDIYSPEIRESSLFGGLNKILRKIEWNVGLSYGTISDPEMVERTATEIRSAKQRSYRFVSRIQSSYTRGFEKLAESVRILAVLYGIVPDGKYEVDAKWGDGVLEDVDKEYQRRWAMVMANKLKAEKFMAWYFNCSEEEAKEMMPEEMPELPAEE